jgi:hypothetical protein
MEVRSLDEALAVYYKAAGDTPIQPARGTEYDETLGGWLFENINGPLALVRDDGTVVHPVYDAKSGEWVVPK